MLTRLLRLLPLAAGLAVAGCIQIPAFPDPPLTSRTVDPTSPVAQRILRGDFAKATEYPSFADVPVPPTDVRPPAAWNASVAALKGEGDALEAWRAANPLGMSDTEAFAAQARSEVGLDPATLPAAPTPAESEAYARSVGGRAVEPK